MMEVPRTKGNDVIVAWGSVDGGDKISDVTDRAQCTGRDVIYLDFSSPVMDGPTNVMVAAIGRKGVSLHENCEVWAFSKRRNRAELLGATCRFDFDQGGRLRSRPNNLDEMRARRVAKAHARWRALAHELLARLASADTPGGGEPTS